MRSTPTAWAKTVLILALVAGIGTLVERLNAASWFCWAFPLLVTEVILQGRKILKAPSPVSSFETGG